MRRNPSSINSQFVRAVVLVKGVHFYGFHTTYSPFLKIHIADPVLVNRAVTLMRSGTVMKTRFLVYESHLGFVLQFLSDFGLYGCGWINLSEVWERVQDEEQDGNTPGFSARASPYYRQTRMPLELDIAAHQILNRHQVYPRNVNHELTIPAPPLPNEPVVLSVRELWEDERRRRIQRGLSPSPPIPTDPSAGSRSPGGGWSAEAQWWEELRKKIESEQIPEPVAAERQQSWERWVMTTFESVEALWEERWRTWRPKQRAQVSAEKAPREFSPEAEENPYEAPATGRSVQPQGQKLFEVGLDVDEVMLSSQELSVLVEREEELERRLEEPLEDEEAERIAEEGPQPEQEYSDESPIQSDVCAEE